MIFTILSIFDNVVGPKVFLRVPRHESSNPINLDNIPLLMDLYKEGFFIHEIGELKTANLIFELSSPIARGHIERCMFSIVSITGKINLNLSSFRDIMEFFVKGLKEIKDIYKGFRYEDIAGSQEKYNEIKDFLYTFHQFLPDKRARVNHNISKIITYGLSPSGKSSIIKFLQDKFSKSKRHIQIVQ